MSLSRYSLFRPTLALLALVALPAITHADDSENPTPFYFGGDLTRSNFKSLMNNLTVGPGACDPVLASGSFCEAHPVARGGRIFGGRIIDDYAAIEVGYDHFGKAKDRYITPGQPTYSLGDFRGHAFEANLVGILPLGMEGLYLEGRMGLYEASTTADGSAVNAPNPSGTGKATASNTGVTLGVGLRYTLVKRLDLRIATQLYNQVGNQSTGVGNIYQTSAGLLWRLK